MTRRHRFLLGHKLCLFEELEQAIAAFDAQVDACSVLFADAVERLMTILGFSRLVADLIAAEIILENEVSC